MSFTFLLGCIIGIIYGKRPPGLNPFRLPHTIIPYHYKINFKYFNETNNTINVDGLIDVIIFREHLDNNYKDLNDLFFIELNMGQEMVLNMFDKARINISNNVYISINDSYNATTEIVVITFNVTNSNVLSMLGDNDSIDGNIFVSVKGTIKDENNTYTNRGVYYSNYNYMDTGCCVNIVTQFQPTDFRRLIPSVKILYYYIYLIHIFLYLCLCRIYCICIYM